MKNNSKTPSACTRAACALLSVTTALLGFPAAAQVPIGGSTPQLLRAQEQLMSAADCASLLRKINFLKAPDYAQKLRNSLASIEKMRAQAEQGKWEADQKLWEELQARSKEYVDDLKKLVLKDAVARAKQEQFKRLIRSMHDRGALPASPSLVPIKKLEDAIERALSSVEKATKASVNVTNRTMDAYLKALKDATTDTKAAQSVEQHLLREFTTDAALKEYGELILAAAKGSGIELPYADLLFKLGYLVATAAPPAIERFYVQPRDIARLQESADQMRDALQRIELDLNMYQGQHRRYCQERPTQRQARAEPPPQPAPPPPQTAPGPSAGAVVGGTVLVGGLIAGAVALAAAAGGGGSSGSSSGPKSCESGQFCRTSGGKEGCCPNGGFIALCHNSNACASIAPFTGAGCPGEAKVVNCCGGAVDCGINAR